MIGRYTTGLRHQITSRRSIALLSVVRDRYYPMFDFCVTTSTECNEIIKAMCLPRIFELTNRCNVVNVRITTDFVISLSASLAFVIVPPKCLHSGPLPSTEIPSLSTLPPVVVLPDSVLGHPF